MSTSGAVETVRRGVAAAGTALFGVLALAAPAAAHASVQPAAADVYTMSAGRLGAATAAVLALIGVIVGGLALVRPASRFRTGSGSGRLGAFVALAAGLTGTALGGLVMATSEGGLGTGNGLGGAVVAVVVGLMSLVLGGTVLARSRRTARPS
ncbi:DUF6223 family protein [Streptomyces lateritius]|uniref:DUF6223 family protein n=1 Tax=Streptomyces lateritius TaxID=67313 RepID=A0ABW6YJW3_9ACTN